MAVTLVAMLPRIGTAQAWNYPSFQQSHVVNREFVFAVADGGNSGTSLLAQWREGIQPSVHQLGLEAGFAAPKHGGRTVGFFGGTYAMQITNETDEQPLEVVGTGGVNVAFGGGTTFFRLPLGVSVGHRFFLQHNSALTPYVHPRVAIEFCNSCGTAGKGRSELGLGVGLGLNFEATRQIAIRLDTSFGFSSIAARDNAVGIGLVWSPLGLRRP